MSMENVFIVWFFFGLSLLVAFPVASLVMNWLLPGNVFKKYFVEPHFRFTEIVIFSGFPLCIYRAMMFSLVICHPRFGVKRQLTSMHMDVPSWYKSISKIYLYLFSGAFLIWIIAFLIMYISTLL